MNKTKTQARAKQAFTLVNAGDLLQGLNSIKKPRNWKAIYNELKQTARDKAPVTVAIRATISPKIEAPILKPLPMAAVFSRKWLGVEIAYKFEGFEKLEG